MKSKASAPTRQEARTSPPGTAVTGWSRVRRQLVLALLAVAIAGGTWGFLEFVLWNRLPPGLVGKWVVQGGEQDGATFDFYRGGTMVGRINVGGREGIVNARVRVEGKTLHSTTTNPNTHKDEVRSQTIEVLSDTSLVLRDDRGRLLTMERAD